MQILQHLDIIIGYAFVMLLLATLSGAVVEAIQTIFRSRTFALEDAISRLLGELGLDTQTAPKTAKEFTSAAPVKGQLMGADVIPREEFVLLLLQKATTDSGVATALQKFNLGDLAQLRLNIEKEILKQEAADPLAPSHVSRVKAMEAAGAGALAGRVFAWYDNMTRRVDDTVTFQGRMLGLVAAAVVSFWLLPVDSLDLLKRLQQDEPFRKALVERAMEEVKKAPPGQPAPRAEPSTGGSTVGQDQSETGTKEAKPETTADSEREKSRVWTAVDRVIAKADETRALIPLTKPRLDWSVGRTLTWVMVSLGSAFWWALLKRFVGLKSSLGEMVDSQRTHRETDQRKPV